MDILILDNGKDSEVLKERFNQRGYSTTGLIACDHEAIKKAAEKAPVLVLMEQSEQDTPEKIEALSRIVARKNIPIIYLVSNPNNKTLQRIQESGVVECIETPSEDEEFISRIECVLHDQTKGMTITEAPSFLSVLKNLPNAVITADENGIITFMNPLAEKLTGWGENEAIGKNLEIIFKRVDEETLTLMESPIKKTLEAGFEFHLRNHACLISKDGTIRLIEDSASPIRDRNGNISGAVLVFQEVTSPQLGKNHPFNYRYLLNTIFSSSTTMLAHLDSNMNYIRVSSAYSKACTKENGFLYGENHFKLFPNREYETIFHQVIQKGEPFVAQNKPLEFLINSENKPYCDWHLLPIKTEEGIISGLILEVADVIPRIEAEEKLRLQTKALESAANGIVITDSSGSILWSNNAFSKLTGFSRDEVIDKTPSILKSGKHDHNFYRNLWNTILSGQVWHGEMINKRKDGSIYNEELMITPVHNLNGELSHFIAIKQDITKRKEAEKALSESEERFRAFFENSTLGIYRTDPDGKFLIANSAFIKTLGYKSFKDLVNINAGAIYANPKERSKFKSLLEKNEKVFGYETELKREDGSTIFVRESSRAVRDSKEKFIYYEGTIEDISDKKRAEEEILIAKDMAENSDRLKSEFLAQMSHEIRTPINALLSFSSLIKDELENEVDEDLKMSFNIISRAGKRIIRTIDLLLHMSELQTGTYDYVPQTVDIYSDVLATQFEEFKMHAKEKNVEFYFRIDTENTKVTADEHIVKQITDNLIDNAIKYTPKGKVEVSLSRNSKSGLLIKVSDSGIGISDEYLPCLFEPFSQEEQGYTRKFEGNGLGLALVKKYCEIIDARIEVESKKGKGSTFTITLKS